MLHIGRECDLLISYIILTMVLAMRFLIIHLVMLICMYMKCSLVYQFHGHCVHNFFFFFFLNENIYEFYSYASILFSCPFFHLFSYPSAASRGNTVTLELGHSNLLLQAVLCAIAEIVSMRFVNGIGQRTGLMGIDYPTACWLYKYNSI